MARSIRTNSTQMLAIGTTYAAAKFIPINATLAGVGGLRAMLDRIVVHFTDPGAASTTIKGTLWWDAAGDDYALMEFTFTRATGLTTATRFTAIATFTNTPIRPTTPDAPAIGSAAEGVMYLGLTCGANTIDVAANAIEVWTRDDTTASN